MTRSDALLGILAVLLALTGCGTPTTSPAGDVAVFAAASLTDVLREIGAAFEEAEPDVSVHLTFAGSQQLARQIIRGDPADVFASADPVQMQQVAGGGLAATEPRVFARNHMTMIVEAGNPLGLDSLADLAREELVVVLPGEEVPAGRYAARVLQQAGVEARPDRREVDVRQVLAEVAVGAADAAIVYASDAVVAGPRVDTIPIPDPVDVVAHYPVAVLRGASDPAAARAFVAFLESTEARRLLVEAGFMVP